MCAVQMQLHVRKKEPPRAQIWISNFWRIGNGPKFHVRASPTPTPPHFVLSPPPGSEKVLKLWCFFKLSLLHVFWWPVGMVSGHSLEDSSWNTGRRLSQCFLHFSDVSCSFPLFGFGGGGGGEGGIRTLVFTAFSPLCTTHCARMWNKTRGHKRPCQIRRCPKHWYLLRFCLVVRHTAQQCGAGRVVTSVHANCDDAQNTGIFHVFASLYNILRKDVEEEKLSQASMPFG